MPDTPVTVDPPHPGGGRRVHAHGVPLGTAYSLHDVAVFLEAAGLEGWDELDVAGWDGITWHGGGPDTWE